MPINGVLTTTLQAVRMSISADGLVFGPVGTNHTEPILLHSVYACSTLGEDDGFYLA